MDTRLLRQSARRALCAAILAVAPLTQAHAQAVVGNACQYGLGAGPVIQGLNTSAATVFSPVTCQSGGTYGYPILTLQSAAAAGGSSCTGYPTGALRWNTTIGATEVCDGTTWDAVGSTSSSCGSISGLSFTNITGAPLSTLETNVTAATITYSGCSSAMSVSVTGGGSPQISINGGNWTTSGAIYSGQTLNVRLTSSSSPSTILTATVTVAASSTNWTVTTAASDPCAASSPAVGTVCQDGSIYAGLSPNGNAKMFIAPCDAGMTGSAGSCTGTRLAETWGGYGCNTYISNQATGNTNTTSLVNESSCQPYAPAEYCAGLSNYLGHSDWYLPASGEMNVILINSASLTGFTTGGNGYSTSTEENTYSNYYGSFSSLSIGGGNKDTAYYVRCARL